MAGKLTVEINASTENPASPIKQTHWTKLFSTTLRMKLLVV
jgi:hypothetical protein